MSPPPFEPWDDAWDEDDLPKREPWQMDGDEGIDEFLWDQYPEWRLWKDLLDSEEEP
jgi:hypothetical protein